MSATDATTADHAQLPSHQSRHLTFQRSFLLSRRTEFFHHTLHLSTLFTGSTQRPYRLLETLHVDTIRVTMMTNCGGERAHVVGFG